MNMKSYLEQFPHTALAMNDIEILPEHIRVVMVNECAPFRDEDDFYGNTDGEYAVSLRSFFSDSEPAHLLARNQCLQAAKAKGGLYQAATAGKLCHSGERAEAI